MVEAEAAKRVTRLDRGGPAEEIGVNDGGRQQGKGVRQREDDDAGRIYRKEKENERRWLKKRRGSVCAERQGGVREEKRAGESNGDAPSVTEWSGASGRGQLFKVGSSRFSRKKKWRLARKCLSLSVSVRWCWC
jgi:hypothetical protein